MLFRSRQEDTARQRGIATDGYIVKHFEISSILIFYKTPAAMSEFWVLTKYKLHVRHYLFDTERVIPEQVIQKKICVMCNWFIEPYSVVNSTTCFRKTVRNHISLRLTRQWEQYGNTTALSYPDIPYISGAYTNINVPLSGAQFIV